MAAQLQFELIPYQGAGPLWFGLSADEVRGFLGAPVAQTKTYFGQPKLIYNGFNIEFEDGRVADITFSRFCDVSLNGRKIENSGEVRAWLLCQSSNNFLGNGALVLLDIGIAMADSGEVFPLTAFARGRMDTLINKGLLRAV